MNENITVETPAAQPVAPVEVNVSVATPNMFSADNLTKAGLASVVVFGVGYLMYRGYKAIREDKAKAADQAEVK